MMNPRQRIALIAGLVITVLVLFMPRVLRTGPHRVSALRHRATQPGAAGVIYATTSVDMELEIKPLGRLWLAAVVLLTAAQH